MTFERDGFQSETSEFVSNLIHFFPWPVCSNPRATPSTSKGFHDNSDRSKDVIDVGQRLLVGNVEQVLRWSRMLSFLEPTKFIYQVFGTHFIWSSSSHFYKIIIIVKIQADFQTFLKFYRDCRLCENWQ